MRNQAKQPKRLTAEAVHAITSALRDFSYKNLTDNRVRGLSDGLLDGSISYPWGTLNKLAVHVGSGIPVDPFATTVERWFVSRVVRIGSKEMYTMLAGRRCGAECSCTCIGCWKCERPASRLFHGPSGQCSNGLACHIANRQTGRVGQWCDGKARRHPDAVR